MPLRSFTLYACATNKDLQILRTEAGQKVSTLSQDLRSVRTESRELSDRQAASMAEVRGDIRTGLDRLQEQVTALENVRQKLENVRADIALLKPLGMV